jgi:hypothetical protein
MAKDVARPQSARGVIIQSPFSLTGAWLQAAANSKAKHVRPIADRA